MVFKEINRDRYVDSQDNVDDKIVGDNCGCRAIHVTNSLCLYGGAGHQHLNFVNIRKLSPTFFPQHHFSHIFCHHTTQ